MRIVQATVDAMITPEQIAKTGTEHAEQAALFQWAALTANERDQANDPWRANALRMMFAIPNGDQRGDGSHKGAQIAGARLKAEGQRSGVPDVFMAVPAGARIIELGGGKQVSGVWKHYGLFIEMKARKHLRAKDELAGCGDDQKDWIVRLRAQGYSCAVCYGWEHARDTIIAYLA